MQSKLSPQIDSVNRPSWQAMIKGKKTWTIEPPPECALECSKRLQATMEPGDICKLKSIFFFTMFCQWRFEIKELILSLLLMNGNL